VLGIARGLLVLGHRHRVLRLRLVRLRDKPGLLAVRDHLPHLPELLGDLDHREVGVIAHEVVALLVGPQKVC